MCTHHRDMWCQLCDFEAFLSWKSKKWGSGWVSHPYIPISRHHFRYVWDPQGSPRTLSLRFWCPRLWEVGRARVNLWACLIFSRCERLFCQPTTAVERGTLCCSVSMDIIGCGMALGGLKSCRWLDGLQLLEAMRCDGGAGATNGSNLCQVGKWLLWLCKANFISNIFQLQNSAFSNHLTFFSPSKTTSVACLQMAWPRQVCQIRTSPATRCCWMLAAGPFPWSY